MKVRLLTLGAIVLAMACNDARQPTGPTVPVDPSKIISDGAHCNNVGITCNPDFFFLPPMVPLAVNNPNFELGKFNNALRPSLKIDICELNSLNLNAQGLPTAGTGCVAGDPIKRFLPGSVQLVNLPLRQNGWWTLFGLPPDGFYYVLWDTRQSNLNVNKYYRIKVFINGISEPLGVADVDPMANLFQWKYTLTGQVIQLVDDVMLPITFRVEKGGGPAVCGGSTICSSATITNDNPTGDVQVVQTPGNNGPIAGAVFPDGWLPVGPGLPTSVVVTIRSVNTGVNNVATGTQQFPCHVGLTLQQFNGCFEFTTTPALAGVAEGGHQFARAVTVVACYVLHDTDDPREPWVQLWSSGPNEPPHPLQSSSDVLVLTAPTEHACGSNFVTVIGSNTPSNPLARLASAGWQKLKAGVSSVFGVKTAYAVDAGLGGLTLDFSRVGPALTAELRAYTSRELTVDGGTATTVTARLVGTQVHNGQALGDVTLTGNTHGIPGLPVTFTLAPGNGTFIPFGSEGGPVTQATVTSSPFEDSSLSGGFATVSWTLPTAPGVYTITATGPGVGGPITYTATVPATDGLVDQSHLAVPTNLGANINDCCRYIAQTFTAGVSGALVGVNVDVGSNSAFPLHVAIRAVSDGVPTATILGETTLNGPASSLSDLIRFPQSIFVNSGVQYAIVVSYPGAPTPGAGQSQGLWGGTTGDLYSGGALYMSVDGTSWSPTGTGHDAHFRTYVSAAIP